MSDIYSIEFDPNKLSHQQEELGMRFADLDTAVELMKKEEKMIIAELTIYFSTQKNYKNMTELNGLIYSDKKFKDYLDRYQRTLKERNRAKIRLESFRAFRDDLRTKVVNERELAKHL
jgi:NACalpha-BTF3-like transcription factor